MKVAFFSTKVYDREYFDRENGAFNYELHYFEPSLTPDTTILAQGFPTICVFVNDKLDAEMLEKLKETGVELIALRCAGFNNVDLEAAHRLGLKVVRVPAYSPHAVAEHAVALIMALNRKTHKAYLRVREQNFSLSRLQGFDLYGKTVGVVGTGKIGRAFCEIMLGFGCKVLAYDKYPNAELTEKGIEYVDFDTLLEASDIVSLHCPLTPETHHLINAEALAKMGPRSMLINTSRGGLIDSNAVIAALKSRRLGYLGIDVYEQEEALFFKDLSEMVIEDDVIARLMSFHNVLITAHQAFFTENALTQIAQTTLTNIQDIIESGASKNEVSIEFVK